MGQELPAHAAPLLVDLILPEKARPGPGDGDEVDARLHEGRVPPKALAAEPLDAIAHDGSADLTGRDDAQPRGAGHAFGDQQDEVWRPDGAPVVLNPQEIGPLAQAAFRAEAKLAAQDTGPNRSTAAFWLRYFLYTVTVRR